MRPEATQAPKRREWSLEQTPASPRGVAGFLHRHALPKVCPSHQAPSVTINDMHFFFYLKGRWGVSQADASLGPRGEDSV